MDFYANSKPSLIGANMKKTVNKIMKNESYTGTISDKLSHYIDELYKDNIKNNKFVVFVLVAVIFFLLYRYYNRASKVQRTEEFYTDNTYRTMNEITDQTNHLNYQPQPHFNRLQSVNKQLHNTTVSYPPDPLPINIPSEGIIYTRGTASDPTGNWRHPYPNLNNPDYDYNNVYKYPQRAYYNGTYNTYADAVDTSIPNPLGYPNNFNTSTGDFIVQSTNANEKSILDYQTIINNMNNNLIDNLQIGPKYLDVNVPDLEMEPPYATE
jgi:hypothetical protein